MAAVAHFKGYGRPKRKGRETLTQRPHGQIVTPLSQQGWMAAAAGTAKPPAAGGAKPGAPTAPAPAGGRSVPLGGELEMALSGIQGTYDNAVAVANSQKQSLYQRFFDPANPFSETAKLKLQEEIASRQLLNGSGDQLVNGSFVNATNIQSRANQEAQYGMKTEYDTRIAGIEQGLSGVRADALRDAAGLRYDHAQYVRDNPELTPTPPKPVTLPKSTSGKLTALGSENPNVRTAASKSFGVLNPDGSVNMQAFAKTWARQLKNAKRKGGFGSGKKKKGK